MSMHSELKEHGLYDCHGWAFDPCDALSQWIMIEQWENGSWGASGLCQKHALEVFAGTASEYRPPMSRTWWNVVDFREHGRWP